MSIFEGPRPARRDQVPPGGGEDEHDRGDILADPRGVQTEMEVGGDPQAPRVLYFYAQEKLIGGIACVG